MKQQLHEALIKEYGEVANNFRLLTDIRFKLLGLLPVAAAASQAWKAEDLSAPRLVLSVFGLAVTLGLYLYNGRNDQFYDSLIGRAAEVERTLGLPEGSFANRPRAWESIRFCGAAPRLDHRKAIEIIYAASGGLWLFGILAPLIDLLRRAYLLVPGVPYLNMDPAPIVNLMGAVLAIFLTWIGVNKFNEQRKEHESKLRESAKTAVKSALNHGLVPALARHDFLKACEKLSGYTSKAIKARAEFYEGLDEKSLAHYLPSDSKRVRAAHLVALLADLPSQLIFNWATGRQCSEEPKRRSKAKATSNTSLESTA
jgi:hypothetical protein